MEKENCELCGQIIFPPLLDEYRKKVSKMIPKIKKLDAPIDFYGKTFIVLTLCKEDLKDYFSETKLEKLTDKDISYIAGKLGDSLMENYWDNLSIICDYYKKDFKK
jgi:hypothetical protein